MIKISLHAHTPQKDYVGTQREQWHLTARRQILTRPWSGTSSLQNWEIQFCCLNYSFSGILLKQSNWININILQFWWLLIKWKMIYLNHCLWKSSAMQQNYFKQITWDVFFHLLQWISAHLYIRGWPKTLILNVE